MQLNWLTNADANVQAKMRYFSDYFLFVNEYLGKMPDLPYDNPISLLDKAIFQIQNNLDRSRKYIENHLDQLSHFYGKFMREEVKAYAPYEVLYATYRNLPKGKKSGWLKNNPSFLHSLKEMLVLIEENLFDKILGYLAQYMQCKHTLATHKEEIEFCTHLLVSLFRLNGHTKPQIAGYIKRILSSDKFPFPKEIYDHKDPAKFEAFIKSRDFKKQFDGLKNLMLNQKLKEGYFIFAIDNVSYDNTIKNTFRHTLDEVTFIAPFHTDLKYIRQTLQKKDKDKPVKIASKFFTDSRLLAYVKINCEDIEFTRHVAFEKIQQELLMLNAYLTMDLSLQSDNFLFSEDIQSESLNSRVRMNRNKVQRLNDIHLEMVGQNPFDLLRDHPLPGKSQLLFNENSFVAAISGRSPSQLWQYMENLLWPKGLNSDQVRDRFEHILLKDLSDLFEDVIFRIGLLFNSVYDDDTGDQISENKEMIETIRLEICYEKNYEFPIEQYESQLRHPFLKELIHTSTKIKAEKHKAQWRAHYHSLILELQEFRNAELHSGVVNTYSSIKLKDMIPPMMLTGRAIIIREMLKNKNIAFGDLMESIST